MKNYPHYHIKTTWQELVQFPHQGLQDCQLQDPMILPAKLPIKKMRPGFISTRFNLIYESAEERPVNTMVTSEIPTIAWGSAHEKLSTLSYKNNMAGTSTIPPPRPTRLPTT